MAKSVKQVVKSVKSAKSTGKFAPKFNVNAKITVLAKGKSNPRRKGTAPFKRYETLIKCRTVGQFLKVLPKWRATINRAQREGFIRVG